jgi:hypothetical protein
MNIGQITQWIQLVIMIMSYGKQVIDLAIEIYERIEEKYAGTKDVGAKKAANFERAFVSEVKASNRITGVTEMKALGNVGEIREGVWKTRPENIGKEPKQIMGKRPPLGTKPGSGGVY